MTALQREITAFVCEGLNHDNVGCHKIIHVLIYLDTFFIYIDLDLCIGSVPWHRSSEHSLVYHIGNRPSLKTSYGKIITFLG